MSTEHEKAQAELASLVAEKAELEKEIPALKAKLANMESRRLEFFNTWQGKGLIYFAKLKVEELKYPVFCSDERGKLTRIMAVTDKWIAVKQDGEPMEDATEYSITTGRKKGARAGTHYEIDAQKALKIWNERVIYEK